MSDFEIGDEQTLHVAIPLVFANDPHITSLDLTLYPWGEMSQLLQYLRHNSTITSVKVKPRISACSGDEKATWLKFCEAIASNKTIVKLAVQGYPPMSGSTLSLDPLILALVNNSTLQQASFVSLGSAEPRMVDLMWSFLPTARGSSLMDSIARISTLKSLHVDDRKLTPSNLARLLHSATTLTSLRLRADNFDNGDLSGLRESLVNHPNLHTLHLGDSFCSITRSMAAAELIGDLLEKTAFLQHLSVRFDSPKNIAADRVFKALKLNLSLRNLKVQAVSAQLMIGLSQAIESHPSIETFQFKLDNCVTELQPADIHAFSMMVQNNTTLTLLCFTGTFRGVLDMLVDDISLPSKESLRSLVNAFRFNQTITDLSFRSNAIGRSNSQMAVQLIQALEQNTALTRLDLSYCATENTEKVLIAALALPSLEELDLSGNSFSRTVNEAEIAIAESVASCKCQRLHLSRCENEEAVRSPICQSLRFNSSLRRIDMDCNDIQELWLEGFAEVMKYNKTLLCFDSISQYDLHSKSEKFKQSCHSIRASLEQNQKLLTLRALPSLSASSVIHPSENTNPGVKQVPSSNRRSSSSASSSSPPSLSSSSASSSSSSSSISPVTYYSPRFVNGVSRVYLSPHSTEFLRVHSQFLVSLAQMPDYTQVNFEITAIEKIKNPRLEQQLYESFRYFYQQGYHSDQPIRPVYHGTHPKNIDSILQNNLSMEKIGQTDSGWFGAGLYFSKHADYVMIYNTTGTRRPVAVGDKGKLLRFDILPGRMHYMDTVKEGSQLEPNYDSHFSPNHFEYVIFDSRHVLPRYVIEFEVHAAPGASYDDSDEKKGPAASMED